MLSRIRIGLVSACVLIGAASGPAAFAAERAAAPGGRPILRIFATVNGEKRYFNGHDWVLWSPARRMAMVEKAREGAVKLNAVMTLPAEFYVRELDRVFMTNPQARDVELGQAIQGVAINLKDWDDGTDPQKSIAEALRSEGGADAPAARKP
jgi:hypothetical protein